MDRHWAIRLRYEKTGAAAAAKALHVIGGPSRIRVGQRAQFVAVVEETDGLMYTPEGMEWHITGGILESPGVVQGSEPGIATLDAQFGALDERVEVVVTDPTWTGVLAADSSRRLGPVVPEGHVDLTGVWTFATDPGDQGLSETWFTAEAFPDPKDIYVPGCWQGQVTELSYHGVGWYRRTFEVPAAWAGKEVWLRFGGVATDAQVWVNGALVGSQHGNWAPFSIRITDALLEGQSNTVTVRVQEKPDHFSAGFARVVGILGGVDNHFGGIWQEVSLFATGSARVQDVYVAPRLEDRTVRVDVETTASDGTQVLATCTILSPDGEVVARNEQAVGDQPTTRFTFQIDAPEAWTPDTPVLYTAQVEVRCDGALSDTHAQRFGMRDVERQGHRILLNGRPISLRGVLHWGYYPDLFSIDPSEETIRKEFRELRAAGFNMVKVCLFVFPKRYYEIADEMGMLLWQEYPLWQTVPAPGDTSQHDIIRAEYEEWVRFDRNHPSVVLRDLTCEANPAVTDMEFLGQIYDMAKTMTDGALIEDNSAFFNHGKTDFYDIHFYRDLDEMYALLPALAELMQSMPKILPYVTGEDMDCDTYRDMATIRNAWHHEGTLPWWLDNNNFRNQEYFESQTNPPGSEVADRLIQAQNQHAIFMRKAMFEEMRRHTELAGYAMTGIRDITATRPGFYDDLDELKWAPEVWASFNSGRVLTLFAERRSRCYEVGETAVFELGLANDGADLVDLPVQWRLMRGDQIIEEGSVMVDAAAGSTGPVARIELVWEADIIGDTPAELRLEALADSGKVSANDWSVWVFPAQTETQTLAMAYSPEGSDALVARLQGLALEPVSPAANREGWAPTGSTENLSGWGLPGKVLVTDALDETVKHALQAGARVIYVTRDLPKPVSGPSIELAPLYQDEGESSGRDDLPRTDAPFWREMAIYLPQGQGALGDFPHAGFVDVQFLDMTQRRPFALGDLRSEVQPLVWGVNCRFNDAFPVVDYLFAGRAGEGHLLACCLNVFGNHNVAGRYLLRQLIAYSGGMDVSGSDDGTVDILPAIMGETD